MATTSKTPDRELSEAAFHAKYGYYAGWDEAREMVYQAMQADCDDSRIMSALRALYDSMNGDARREQYDAYARRTEL